MKVIDESRAVDVYMDFSKAFDKVFHSGLIQKMVVWIQNWLKHRSLRVMVEGCYSDWRSGTIVFSKDQ